MQTSFAFIRRGRGLSTTPSESTRLALGLGRDLFQLTALHGRQGLARRALFRVGEGAAMGLDSLAHRIEELALPLGQGNARLLCRATGAFQGVERRSLRRLLLLLPGAQRRFGFKGAAALQAAGA